MVWATIVLPGLIPFMFLSKILATMPYTFKSCFVLSKTCKKCFRCPEVTGYIYFMSMLSGYPLGAKLIKDFTDSKMLSYEEAKKATSFCSTSGPIFMIGSVGVSLLGSYKAGIIIFLSHILGAFVNGLLFRGKKSAITNSTFRLENNNENILNDSMYSTVISSIIVGGFIAFTFLLIDILSNIGVLTTIGTLIDNTLFMGKLNIGQALSSGLIEVTRGCLELSQTSLSMPIKTIACSGLTAFGGVSVHLQSMVFLSSIKVPYSHFVKTKFTHTLFTIIFAISLSLILL